MAEKKLDMLGEVCPVPLLAAIREMERLNSGDMLWVETDYNRTVRNIMKWCDDNGINFFVEDKDNGVWLVKIEKE